MIGSQLKVISMAANPRPKERLIKILESELSSGYTPQNIKDAFNNIINKIKSNNVKVKEINQIHTDFSYHPIGDFSYFRCPNCGRIYKLSEALEVKKEFVCPHCKRKLIHAYVGAPVDYGGIKPNYLIEGSPSIGRSNIDDILNISNALKIKCEQDNSKLKAVVPLNPNRPIASLTYKCPWDNPGCQYYSNGLCTAGGLYRLMFPSSGGIKRIPSLPSEAFTKPYFISIYENYEGDLRKLTDEFKEHFNDVFIGKFRIWVLVMFYLLGNAYAPRAKRRPVLLQDNNGNLIFIGRKMDTEGILFRLDWKKVQEVTQRLNELGLPVNEYIVAHSVAHVLLKSVVHTSGLSYIEFGESIYIDVENKIAEVLIYDDSPGGIGGVKVVGQAIPDFKYRLLQNSDACPRSCTRACRACLYLENCGRLNFNLSWMAAYHYFRIG